MVHAGGIASYRRHLVAIGIAVAAVFAGATAVALTVIAGGLEKAAEQKAEQQAGAYAKRADVAIERRCRPLAAPSQLQCVHEEREAARQGARAERELESQVVTAVWTKYADIAVIFGTSAGVVGLGLVLGTFWQNKRSADAQRDTLAHQRDVSAAELRPWIVAECGLLKFAADEHRLDFDYVVTFSNIGKTVASEFYYSTTSLLPWEDAVEAAEATFDDFRNADKEASHRALLPNERFPAGGSAIRNRQFIKWAPGARRATPFSLS